MSGIRRLIAEQIERAIAELDQPVLTDDRIHDVRKELKRVRAELRLIRRASGEHRFRADNLALRDVARSLSPVRDARVMIDALDDLTARRPWRIARQPEIGKLRKHLKAELRRTSQMFAARGPMQSEPGPVLKEMADRYRSRPEVDRSPSVLRGLRKVYRTGRRGMKVALATRADGALHEWRKESRYLRYALDMLTPLAPEVLGDLADRSRQLTDYLGDDHDLALLAALVTGHRELLAHESDAAELLTIIAGRREVLQQKAFRCGKRLYRRKPKAVVSRIARLWQLARPSTGESPRG